MGLSIQCVQKISRKPIIYNPLIRMHVCVSGGQKFQVFLKFCARKKWMMSKFGKAKLCTGCFLENFFNSVLQGTFQEAFVLFVVVFICCYVVVVLSLVSPSLFLIMDTAEVFQMGVKRSQLTLKNLTRTFCLGFLIWFTFSDRIVDIILGNNLLL